MNVFQRFVNYLRSSKIELEKVAWPTKQDVVRYSALIVGVSVAAALFFAALDTALHAGITGIIARRNGAAVTQTTPVTPNLVDVTTEPTSAGEVQTIPTENVITGGDANPVAPSQP